MTTLVIDQPTEYVDRSLPTASWWDRYQLLPGEYQVRWVNIDHTPWNPDPQVRTPGFVANIGPYYGLVLVNALLVEQFRVSTLMGETRARRQAACEHVTLRQSEYAYRFPGCPKGTHGRPLAEWLGGRVVTP